MDRREESKYAGAERDLGGKREGGREVGMEGKKQRRGMKTVHVCCRILRRLATG